MTESDVRDMALRGVYQNTSLKAKVEETHISWVLLTRKYAFKIKKPVRLSFLDFSSLELRKEFCERECRLNSRFSDIYLGVLPIRFANKQWVIGGDDDALTVDYCVVMRRMAVSKRLDNVLRKRQTKEKGIRALALEIAKFHKKAETIFTPFEIEKHRGIFNDIGTIIQPSANGNLVRFGDIIKRAIGWSDGFLEKHGKRIQNRIDHGLKRDLHGDLHCGNIFLYSKPVLFDCIEFNDEYRQIDVLYEMAFLCMDLERFHLKHLSEILLDEYTKHFPAFQEDEDYDLFVYFKSLRANIRAKVHALQWKQADSESEATYHISETRKYLGLMTDYMLSTGAHFARH